MEHKIFISYQSEDYEDAAWVRSCLEENGFSCLMSDGSYKAIPAIESCRAFVLILSQKTQSSMHIKKEIELALDNNKPIIPFMIEKCNLQTAFLYYLADIRRLDAYKDRSAEMKRMIDYLKRLTGGSLNDVNS